MIVWGGIGGGTAAKLFNDGGRFDPATNTWIALSSAGAPRPRSGHVAVWTGTEMIVWGRQGASSATYEVLRDGARFDPASSS